MGGGSENQMLQGSCLITQYDNYTKGQDSWMINEGEDDGEDMYDTSTESTSISDRSTSSSELVDDASSSSTSSSSCSFSLRSSDGPLDDLSNLMAQLPIKRGLSKYFEGKCQSFTSLSQVKSIEDLAKKESSYNQRKALIRASKSYGGGLGNYRACVLPKATISKIKKASSTSRVPIRAKGSSLIAMNTLPPIPVRKKF